MTESQLPASGISLGAPSTKKKGKHKKRNAV